MPTRFYLRTGEYPGAPDESAPLSSALPAGSDATDVPFTRWFALAHDKGSALATVSEQSLAQTAHQDGCMGVFASAPLKAQTIGAGTWDLGLAVDTTNLAANAFLALSLYIWRPSTQGVVGYIYDSDTALGTEFPTSSTGQLYSISGSSITVEDDDRLVLECWFHATQDDAVSRTNLVQYGGATDVFAGSTGLSQASWIDPPAAVDLFEGVFPVAFQATTGSGATLSIGGTGPCNLSDLVLLVVIGKGAASNLGINAASGTTGWTELEKGTFGSYCYGLWWLEVSSDDMNTNQTLDTTVVDIGSLPAIGSTFVWRNQVVGDPFVSWDALVSSHASGTQIPIPAPVSSNAVSSDAHTDCVGVAFDLSSELEGSGAWVAVAAFAPPIGVATIDPPAGMTELFEISQNDEETLEVSWRIFLEAEIYGWDVITV